MTFIKIDYEDAIAFVTGQMSGRALLTHYMPAEDAERHYVDEVHFEMDAACYGNNKVAFCSATIGEVEFLDEVVFDNPAITDEDESAFMSASMQCDDTKNVAFYAAAAEAIDAVEEDIII